MPPKTVICVTCNQEVMKSQTLAIGGGTRACRSHEDTLKVSKDLQENERKSKERTRAKERARFNRQHRPRGSDAMMEDAKKFGDYARNHCWTCGCDGISEREYYAEAMIALERLQIREEFNFLTFQADVHKLMGSPVILHHIPYDDSKDHVLRKEIRDRRVKELLHFIRGVTMCPSCLDKHNVRDRLPLPMKITPEQFETGMVISSIMQPAIHALAVKKEKQN